MGHFSPSQQTSWWFQTTYKKPLPLKILKIYLIIINFINILLIKNLNYNIEIYKKINF